jgi:hypothetical protein
MTDTEILTFLLEHTEESLNIVHLNLEVDYIDKGKNRSEIHINAYIHANSAIYYVWNEKRIFKFCSSKKGLMRDSYYANFETWEKFKDHVLFDAKFEP